MNVRLRYDRNSRLAPRSKQTARKHDYAPRLARQQVRACTASRSAIDQCCSTGKTSPAIETISDNHGLLRAISSDVALKMMTDINSAFEKPLFARQVLVVVATSCVTACVYSEYSCAQILPVHIEAVRVDACANISCAHRSPAYTMNLSTLYEPTNEFAIVDGRI